MEAPLDIRQLKPSGLYKVILTQEARVSGSGTF